MAFEAGAANHGAGDMAGGVDQWSAVPAVTRGWDSKRRAIHRPGSEGSGSASEGDAEADAARVEFPYRSGCLSPRSRSVGPTGRHAGAQFEAASLLRQNLGKR